MEKRIYHWASRLVVLAIACMAVSTFVACGDGDDEDDYGVEVDERYASIFGTWERTFQDAEGIDHFVRYTFRKNGTGKYSSWYVKNGGRTEVWGEITFQEEWVLKQGSFLGEITYHNRSYGNDTPIKVTWYMYVSDEKLYIKKDNYSSLEVYYRIN